MTRLANGWAVPDDQLLHGEKGLARAWGWTYKSLQWRLTAARKKPNNLNRWLLRLPRESGRLCVPAWQAMEIYRVHVIAEKVRFAPAPPGSKKRPGSPDFSHPLSFKNPRDEELYQQHLLEHEQNRREYERFEARN